MQRTVDAPLGIGLLLSNCARRRWLFGVVLAILTLCFTRTNGSTPAVHAAPARVSLLAPLNQAAAPMLVPGWFGDDYDHARSVAWGDVDGDGDLDLAVGNSNDPPAPGQPPNPGEPEKIYLNEGGTLQGQAAWTSGTLDHTNSIVWGDADGDGDLDLAVGNDGQPNRVYFLQVNPDGVIQTVNIWQPTDTVNDQTQSVAWGDIDGDGDLDLVVGNSTTNLNKIYRNDGGALQTSPIWSSPEAERTRSIALGDMDNDGDLDLVTGNNQRPIWIYLFEDDPQTSALEVASRISLANSNPTTSIALGDVNGDGYRDLAVGNSTNVEIETGAVSYAYRNLGNGALAPTPVWTSTVGAHTRSVAWGDVDGDGDLDLALGTYNDGSRIHLNVNGKLNGTPDWFAGDFDRTFSIAWGDIDGDGDLDLASGNNDQANKVYFNRKLGLQTDGTPVLSDADHSFSVAWGDMDNDGDLDLAVGNVGAPEQPEAVKVYRNHAGKLTSLAWSSPLPDGNRAHAVAWGDMNNDGYLDLAVANDFEDGLLPNRVYRNMGGSGQFAAGWSSVGNNNSKSVAWGDVDNDGDLDLAIANFRHPVKVYLNAGGVLQTDADSPWQSNDSSHGRSVAWGDVDNDGDLDLALGNAGETGEPGDPVKLYLNQAGELQRDPIWQSSDGGYTRSIAWGDVDGDGDLDLAVGGVDRPHKLYFNDRGMLETLPAWRSDDGNVTTGSVAWGDADGDGDLDLAVGNYGEPSRVYLNRDGELEMIASWVSDENDHTRSVAWGDVDNDGDLDLAIGNAENLNKPGKIKKIHYNRRPAHPLYPQLRQTTNQPAAIHVHLCSNPAPTCNGQLATPLAPANGYAIPAVRQLGVIPIPYSLIHPAGEPVRAVRVYYSLDNSFSGDRTGWLVAQPTPGTQTTNLATSPILTPTAANTHVFYWDVFASGFFGQSDNVAIRIEVLPYLKPVPNAVPGPFQRPFVSAQTFSFRARGTQIRVMTTANGGQPAADALVYRLPADQTRDALPFWDRGEIPFRTDQQGYLQGRDRLAATDRLIALWPVTPPPSLPISNSPSFTVYHTSAVPTISGLSAYTVTNSGVQTLTVSAARPLILFNLVVSLEWDARNDEDFLTGLADDLRRTSQLLYDLSNGQAALGDLRIYHEKGLWGKADLVIVANNSQRPSAIMGGIVLTPTADVDVHGQLLPDAYVPGQVRMGPTWNRFGAANRSEGEDWPRALAHELGHYLFFLADNYLGLKSNGQLALVQCAGSDMTNPYEEDHSEFLTRTEWTGECLNTLANRFLGRADWETITRHYPFLDGSTRNPGPSQLPLALTQITTFAPLTPTTNLISPYFNLIDGNNNTTTIADGRGEAYLLKRRNTSDPTDDYLIAEGAPVGDQILARGAAPNDRLCLFDYSRKPLRLGCQIVGAAPGSIRLTDTPNWEPQIQVLGVTSNTIIVTVTNVAETNISLQLLPALGIASGELAMVPTGANFVQTVTAADGAFYGYVRIWVPGSNPLKELIVEYTAIEAWNGRAYAWGSDTDTWGGRAYAWGGRAYAWGGRLRRWGAPTMSSDGQVSIFPLDNPFGKSDEFTLQTVSFPPQLPTWLTPVGQAYRVVGAASITNSALLFRYLASDVPPSYEDYLNIYYSSDEGATWQRLATQLDVEHNHASAPLPGEGVYLLVATIPVQPPFEIGWNMFGYPLQKTQPIAQALASIEGAYRSVYAYDPRRSPPWRLYDPTVQPPFVDLINTLTLFEYQRGYWINVTRPVTLYLGVADQSADVISSEQTDTQPPNITLAPATYYGWLTPTVDWALSVGMSISAEIDGALCGATTVQALAGQYGYVLQVAAGADTTTPGCGAEGKEIIFKVGDRVMGQPVAWDNTQAHFHTLQPVIVSEPSLSQVQYLPLIRQ